MMEEQKLTSGLPKRRQGMGFLPFFEDYNIYRSLKLVAAQDKLKIGSLIITIVQNHYLELMKQPLNVNDSVVFHKQLQEANQKQRTKSVADFMEYCCSKWIEKEFPKRFMPGIKRG